MLGAFNFTYPYDIDAFEKAFMKLGISVTPECHAVFVHLPQWLNLGKGPLGHSEQALEANHYEYLKFLDKYSFNPLKPEQVCKQSLHAVNKHNALHMYDPTM